MAQFYGSVRGNTKEVHRLGTKASGLTTVAASWKGAVRVTLEEIDGVDYARVSLIRWHGQGVSELLYLGPVGGKKSE